MPELTLTVNQLLQLPEEGLPREILRTGISDEEYKSFQAKIAAALPGMSAASLEKTVLAKLSEVLNIDPIQLFADVWKKYQAVVDAAEKSKSGETVFVPMAQHPITSYLHPYIEILLGPESIKKIEFVVTLTLTLKGIILKVEAERIRAIEAGTCEGSGEISVFKQSIWKREIKPISLLGTIKLGGGIPIR